MPPKTKYSDPKLREEVKEEIQASDKGGAPGQWSARKAQMMAKEYKKRGGAYNTPKEDQDESQKHLSKWTEEEWQTKEGSANAKQEDGTQKRYLPKKAWDEMSEKEKEETDKKKQKGSKEGNQFVQNTKRAKDARKMANKSEDEAYEKKNKKEEEKKSSSNKASNNGNQRQTRSQTKSEGQGKEQPSKVGDDNGKISKGRVSQAKGKRNREEDEEHEEGEEPAKKEQKRDKQEQPKTKSNKTIGSRHDEAEAPAKQGSFSRLPKKGQTTHWKVMPGWVEGTVIEVLKANKDIEGKSVKATKNDPRIVLKSSASGKICVHTPDNVYFD